MNIQEKLVGYRISKEFVMFSCASVQEKSECLSMLCGLGFEKEIMFDCMAYRMPNALFVGLWAGLTITIHVVQPMILFPSIIEWDSFMFEFA